MKNVFKKLSVLATVVALSATTYAGVSKADTRSFVELPWEQVEDTSVVLDLDQSLYNVDTDTITITQTNGNPVDAEVINSDTDTTYNNDYRITGLRSSTVYHFDVTASNGVSQHIDLITNPSDDDTQYNDGIGRTPGWDLVRTTNLIFTKQSSYSTEIVPAESTGGDFKLWHEAFRSMAGTQVDATVEVWEDDGLSGDDFVTKYTWGQFLKGDGYPHEVTFSAEKWKDGSNNRAEFYLIIKTGEFTSDRYVDFKFYD